MIGAKIPASREAVAAKASPVPRDGVAKTSGASVRMKRGKVSLVDREEGYSSGLD